MKPLRFALLCVLFLAGCGRTPTAPKPLVLCGTVPLVWLRVYMTNAEGVGRLDSIPVVWRQVCQ